MLIAVLIIYIILIFPIFLNIKIDFNIESKKLYFKLYLFNFVKVVNGLIEKENGGFLICINKKKQKFLPYKDMLTVRTKAKPLKDYHFIGFDTSISLGLKNNILSCTEIAFIYNYIYQNVLWYFYHKKPYLRLKNNVQIFETENLFEIKIKATVLLNILMIIISFIKIIMEKTKNAITKQLQQNK